MYAKFIIYELKKMVHLLEKSGNMETLDDGALLKKIEDYVNQLSGFGDEEKKELSQQFHICREDSKTKCIMLAVANALENWRISLSSYQADAMAEYYEKKQDRQEEKGFRSPYISSAKPFYFATECDAYSNHIVPKHIYFQIKEWWEDHLHEYQRKEIAAEVGKIEVVGYASKKGGESLNLRLRADRAWKTAKALELVLKEGIKDREIKLVAWIISDSQYEDFLRRQGASPTARRPRAGGDKKAKENTKMLPIFYLGENIDVYPDRRVFRGEGSYVMDLVVDTTVDIKEPLKEITDDPEDRAVLVIFKRKIPEKVNQIIKNVVITNNASPIFTYRKILSHEMGGGKIRMVVFVCPGEFAN
jgi:hypothetical protein